MRILAEDTIALAVDFQEKLMPLIDGADEMEEKSVRLLRGLSVLEIPIYVTRQYPKGLGDTVGKIREATVHAPVLDKISFSCMDDESICSAVMKTGKKNVILCGIETHICLLQTAIDLQEKGYRAILVADCVGSRKPYDKKIALKRAAQEGVCLTTYEALLFELARKAGTAVFKEISKLVK